MSGLPHSNFEFVSGFDIQISNLSLLSTLVFDNVDHSWLWLLGVAAGGWALFAIYRGIYRRTEHRVTWWLMGLRGAGLLALLLALAKPTWIDRTAHVEPGRLAVVVDNSLSMSLADASGQTRYARARQAVLELQRVVENQSGGARMKVELFDINGELLAGGLPAQAKAERTDLATALNHAQARLRSQPLVGVVLVSDGMDNTGRDSSFAAADSPVPIYTIGFQPDRDAARLDLAVSRVTAPPRVMIHNTVKVDVQVEKSGGPAVNATVTVKRGRETFGTQTVAWLEGTAEKTVSLTITPTEAGSFVFTAAVQADAGEKLLANNARQFPLQVDAEAIRVFYVEGFLRYEYKFLKTRLEDDPDVSLVSIVRRANPDRDPTASGGELLTPERLKNFEVVILGDMEGDYLSDAEYRAVLQWINDGHALLVLGGYRSFGLNGFRKTPLAEALPVVFAEKDPFQNEDPFVLALTEAGNRHPMFEITGDRVRDGALWQGAPPLLGCSIVARAKPGADVLAVNPNFVQNGQPLPVVVAQRYGAGHVTVLAVDTTWRWSRLTRVHGQADTLFARFWSQTIRWLAGRGPQTDRSPLVVSTDKPDYPVGKPVTIRVVRQGAGEVTVAVTGQDGKAVPVQAQANSVEPDVFVGTVYPSAGGRYEVTALLTAGGKLAANQTVDFLVQGSDIELADTQTNPHLLQSLAAASGGLYYDIAEAGALAGKIDRRDWRTWQAQRAEFWNSSWLFLFFLAAVTAEWVLRRRNHLV